VGCQKGVIHRAGRPLSEDFH